MRRFERLISHKRFELSIVKVSHSASTIFGGTVYEKIDTQRLFAEFEETRECNKGKACLKARRILKDALDGENVSVHLVLSEMSAVWTRWAPSSDDAAEIVRMIETPDFSNGVAAGLYCAVYGMSPPCMRDSIEATVESDVRVVHLPDCVENDPAIRFDKCRYLSCVKFRVSSPLERICTVAFSEGHVREVCIPDSVEELCNKCFYSCKSLSRVTFGECSSLKRIGISAFGQSCLEEIHIPDTVEELCDMCFSQCMCLVSVTFGASSSLKRIGVEAFFPCVNLLEIRIPDAVEELCEKCFSQCSRLSRVTFGERSSCTRIASNAFLWCKCLTAIYIPDSVQELCKDGFYGCKNLARVTFGERSSLMSIGVGCFCDSGLSQISLPASVLAVGGCAFSARQQCHMICDSNSSFTVVDCLLLSKDGRACYGCVGGLDEVSIPDSVESICEECFSGCRSLVSVRFGPASSLKWIGNKAFGAGSLQEIHAPGIIQRILKRSIPPHVKLVLYTKAGEKRDH